MLARGRGQDSITLASHCRVPMLRLNASELTYKETPCLNVKRSLAGPFMFFFTGPYMLALRA